jgi:NNP family nitrate/nitrite transporter-like MFS transporter
VFQLVPLRFPKEIGVLTGVVGAAGGAGGFFLPILLGGLRQGTGSFAGGFAVFSLAVLGCAVVLVQVGRRWQTSFAGEGGVATVSRQPLALQTSEGGDL